LQALLALEDGLILKGRSFTGPGEALGEVVFNTSMTGYQEILTDPSYKGQIVTMTYPLMGNYGINFEDIESQGIQVEGFIVKEYHPYPSNWRAKGDLAGYLKASGKLGVEGFDTRAITKRLREAGAMRGIISTLDLDPERLVRRVREEVPDMNGLDLVPLVTCPAPYWWDEATVGAGFKPAPTNVEQPPSATVSGAQTPSQVTTTPVAQASRLCTFEDLQTLWQQRSGKKVILYDYGVKFNIIRSLKARGLEVLVVPAKTPAEDILRLNPDGIVLSNGPGDPAAVTYAIENVMALGGRTFKLKFGHRGANQPVKNRITGRVEITSQNHGFAVDIDSIPDPAVELTHFNLNDNTLEGLRHPKLRCFSVQYHPEASPGPHDANYLFDEFLKTIL
jgi:carbamoyl-phosphate synthase small subunit